MERIDRELKRELRRFTPSGAIADIVEAWPAAVGVAVARNAWPAHVARDGTLHVATSSSTWAFELGQLAPMILERLRETIGEATPQAIRFALGLVPEPPAEEAGEARPARPQPGPEELAEAAQLVAGIEDEGLRERVAKALALSLAQSAADRRF